MEVLHMIASLGACRHVGVYMLTTVVDPSRDPKAEPQKVDSLDISCSPTTLKKRRVLETISEMDNTSWEVIYTAILTTKDIEALSEVKYGTFNTVATVKKSTSPQFGDKMFVDLRVFNGKYPTKSGIALTPVEFGALIKHTIDVDKLYGFWEKGVERSLIMKKTDDAVFNFELFYHGNDKKPSIDMSKNEIIALQKVANTIKEKIQA
jgi:hypothetical protein